MSVSAYPAAIVESQPHPLMGRKCRYDRGETKLQEYLQREQTCKGVVISLDRWSERNQYQRRRHQCRDRLRDLACHAPYSRSFKERLLHESHLADQGQLVRLSHRCASTRTGS